MDKYVNEIDYNVASVHKKDDKCKHRAAILGK